MAYALAAGLYARDKQLTLSEQAASLYELVDGLDYGEDDRKADLYAQLEDNLTDTTRFADAVVIIADAMLRTDMRYPLG